MKPGKRKKENKENKTVGKLCGGGNTTTNQLYYKNTIASILHKQTESGAESSSAPNLYAFETAKSAVVARSVAFPEKQRYAPYAGKTDKSVYHTAHGRCLPAEYPGDYVKFENAYNTPVKRTDNRQHKGYPVHDHC